MGVRYGRDPYDVLNKNTPVPAGTGVPLHKQNKQNTTFTGSAFPPVSPAEAGFWGSSASQQIGMCVW